jgi:serine/threonine-protein kinase RsbW
VRLEIVIGSGTLDQLQAAFDTFWSLHERVPAAIRMQIGIAAAEVAANIVEHGDGKWLWVSMHLDRTEMQVEFTDDGSPVNLDLAAVTMPDVFAERGRGLALAKAALGLFSYQRDQLGNHWKMISQAFGPAVERSSAGPTGR